MTKRGRKELLDPAWNRRLRVEGARLKPPRLGRGAGRMSGDDWFAMLSFWSPRWDRLRRPPLPNPPDLKL
jgi:hypothetical protein